MDPGFARVQAELWRLGGSFHISEHKLVCFAGSLPPRAFDREKIGATASWQYSEL